MIDKYIEELTKICAITEPLKVSGDEIALEKLKSKIKAELPKPFESFYKKYDGEANISGFVAGFELLPINRVISEFDFLKKSGIEFEAIGTEAISDKPTSKNKWIPFAFDGSDCFFAVDLSPSKKGIVGQIIGLDMEKDYAFLFEDSFDAFFEKLAKLVVQGALAVEVAEEVIVSEVSGHFFNHVTDYAIIDENIQNIDIVLEDDFWIKKFEKQLKNKDGKNVISSQTLGKLTGAFRIMNDPQKLSCKPFEFMDNIKELIIHHCELHDFECITKMKNLTTLFLIDCTTPESNVSVLADAPKLKRLSLGAIKEQIDMKKLSKSKSLKDLSVRALDGVNLEDLSEFGELTSLTVEGGDSEEYGFLSKLEKLKILKIKNVQLDNLGFLYNLTKLEEFEMHVPAKNEDGLMAIGGMTKIKIFIYPVKNLMIYKDVPGIVEAGIAYNNDGEFEVFKESKLNSFMLIGNGEKDMMKKAESIKNDIEKYGLKITSYGSVG